MEMIICRPLTIVRCSVARQLLLYIIVHTNLLWCTCTQSLDYLLITNSNTNFDFNYSFLTSRAIWIFPTTSIKFKFNISHYFFITILV